MKKSLVIIFAIALLGGAGLMAKKSDGTISATPGASPSSPTASRSSSSKNGAPYKDGSYTGSAADTPYGTVQIAVVVLSGKISDVNFLKMPDDQPHSREVTATSEPQLKQNTLDAQSASIDFVTGATSTCYGYKESLQKALDQANQS
jgi:uncharacterized protein with FMN-binding domain